MKEPPCRRCQEEKLDFCVHEDQNGAGYGVLEFTCTNSSCGYKVSIALL